MNKYGKLSFVTCVICLILSFFISENMEYSRLFLLIATIISFSGIVFAFLSKKVMNMIFGVTLNVFAWVFFFMLILVVGIGVN